MIALEEEDIGAGFLAKIVRSILKYRSIKSLALCGMKLLYVFAILQGFVIHERRCGIAQNLRQTAGKAARKIGIAIGILAMGKEHIFSDTVIFKTPWLLAIAGSDLR